MMAGQMEEPIGFNLQADSVHSGSISFGRFAHEPLLWERRSSFSHNRIEEEVARCSKHRIVTEKKAFFEAQFKKKALLRQCSLDAQMRIQCEKGGKDNLDMRNCEEDNELVQGNDTSRDTSVYIGYGEDNEYVEESQMNVHFDESSDGLNDYEEQGIEYHIEGREITISEAMKLPLSDYVESKVGAGTDAVIDAQIVIDCPYSRCNSDKHDVEAEQNIDADTSYVLDECKDIGLCTESQCFEKNPDCESLHSGVFPKVTVAVEPSGTVLNVKVARTQKDSLCESAKMATRNRTNMGLVSAVATKTFKQVKIVPSTPKKLHRSPNPERLLSKSTSFISKTPNGLKSAYKVQAVGLTKSSVTTMLNGAPNANQNPKRTEKLIATKISDLNSRPILRLRSNVRADEKEEMLSRVKQTDHTQKTEMNRSHARVQGKIPDEIKQFSRDLNAKAKPVRPLYNKDERLAPKSKDIIAKMPQMNSLHTRTKVMARSSMNLKAENGTPSCPSQSQASTGHPRITSYPGKKYTSTNVVSSPVNMSSHPSSTRNAVSSKRMAGTDKVANMKNKMVAPKVEATKGRGTMWISQSVSGRPKKCATTNVTEKARPPGLCRTAAKVF